MAVGIEIRSSFGVIVPVVEPVSPANGLVPVNFQDDVRNIVTSGSGIRSFFFLRSGGGFAFRNGFTFGGGFTFRHASQKFTDFVMALGLHAYYVQDAVLGKCRNIGVEIVKIQRKHVAGLKVLNLCTVFSINGGLGLRRSAGKSQNQ